MLFQASLYQLFAVPASLGPVRHHSSGSGQNNDGPPALGQREMEPSPGNGSNSLPDAPLQSADAGPGKTSDQCQRVNLMMANLQQTFRSFRIADKVENDTPIKVCNSIAMYVRGWLGLIWMIVSL